MVQPEKVKAVEETVERLGRAQSVVCLGYKGLTVSEMSNLRNELRREDSELKVLKNRLTRLSLTEADCEALDDILIGPNALAFGYGDPTGPAKVCSRFAKGNEKLVIKAGLLEKKRIDLSMIMALSKLPSRPELLTQMAATILAPARQMATALNASLSKIVYAMKDRADQMET